MGKIFNIQRFSVHDGPGIRTTVFMKGCPLNCIWCHNPESKSEKTHLAFYSDKCTLCGECAKQCSCHIITDIHTIDRKLCRTCGKCVDKCRNRALELIGKDVNISDIMEEVMRDKAFYESSGGGITLSGGEPLYQPEFALQLLKAAKEEKINTCVDTSGYAPFDNIRRIIKFTDLFLYDIKETDDSLHRKFTGVSNSIILENLKCADSLGAKTILRCPVIPGCNDREEHYVEIARLAENLKNVIKINIMPYHILGSSKCKSIGSEYLLTGTVPLTDTEKEKCLKIITENTGVAAEIS